ncbi:MAG: hypothetical protein ACI8T1_001627 [Verrucomicrobiales bacterium]
MEAAGRSEKDFAVELDETAPRVDQSLKNFLEVISQGHAGLRLESGDFRCTLSPAEATDAYQRVSDTITKDEEITERGVFKGALLESWRFDFMKATGHKITGKLDENLTQDEAVIMSRTYLERECLAALTKTTVHFKNGQDNLQARPPQRCLA